MAHKKGGGSSRNGRDSKAQKRGVKVWRSYVGEYCTSLEMNGMSVTLCKVDDRLKQC